MMRIKLLLQSLYLDLVTCTKAFFRVFETEPPMDAVVRQHDTLTKYMNQNAPKQFPIFEEISDAHK